MRMRTFDHHGLILCVLVDLLPKKICFHTIDMKPSYLHELTLCASEDVLSEKILTHNVDMETFVLHE